MLTLTSGRGGTERKSAQNALVALQQMCIIIQETQLLRRTCTAGDGCHCCGHDQEVGQQGIGPVPEGVHGPMCNTMTEHIKRPSEV